VGFQIGGIRIIMSDFFWLSYADEKTENFNGGLIIEAPSFEEAVFKARKLNLSPGGQVVGQEIFKEFTDCINKKDINRLLNKKESLQFIKKLDDLDEKLYKDRNYGCVND
jgi:hypothetical protein